MTSKKQKLSSSLLDTSKPSALFKPTGGRSWTLSVALPGSIIAKRNSQPTATSSAQSHDQKTFLAGTIGRALAVFNVDEVVVFDDEPIQPKKNNGAASGSTQDDSYTAYSEPGHFLSHLLSYLETPPYLRKYLFPMHKNLRTAGTLPSLDMPHHLKAHEWCQYREGVTYSDDVESSTANHESGSQKKKKRRKDDSPPTTQTNVDIGLPDPVSLPLPIPPNTRITLKFPNENSTSAAEAVAPTTPREDAGYYWGYTVRRCPSISAVFTECSFDGGYDLSFGTSERGQSLQELVSGWERRNFRVPEFQHLVVVFGGLAGLEAAVKADPELKSRDVVEARELFDFWINVCPGQGSRTIRTEEAIWMGLIGLRGFVMENGMS